MTTLVVTDLHLTDKPKDAYRFGIFDFLVEQQQKHNASLVLILGDITDQKDKHSSNLVNRIIDGLHKVAARVRVIILMGNHDYHADPTNPFFKFLNRMKNIDFITEPTVMYHDPAMFFVPHTRNEDEWNALKPDRPVGLAFIHQTVTGAISESGRRLDGFSLKPLKRLKCPVFSGDVHSPHTIGPVIYVGPPYHIRFGDNFNPRCLVLDERTGEFEEIYFDCPRKWTLRIRDPQEIESDERLRAGDQVKVELELTREEVVQWPVYKDRLVQVLKNLQLVSFGIELKVDKAGKRPREEKSNEEVKRQHQSPPEVLGSYCKREKLPRAFRKEGLRLLQQ